MRGSFSRKTPTSPIPTRFAFLIASAVKPALLQRSEHRCLGLDALSVEHRSERSRSVASRDCSLYIRFVSAAGLPRPYFQRERRAPYPVWTFNPFALTDAGTGIHLLDHISHHKLKLGSHASSFSMLSPLPCRGRHSPNALDKTLGARRFAARVREEERKPGKKVNVFQLSG